MLLKQILWRENCPVTKYISQLHLTLLIQFVGVVNAKYRFKNIFWSFVGYDAV